MHRFKRSVLLVDGASWPKAAGRLCAAKTHKQTSAELRRSAERNPGDAASHTTICTVRKVSGWGERRMHTLRIQLREVTGALNPPSAPSGDRLREAGALGANDGL